MQNKYYWLVLISTIHMVLISFFYNMGSGIGRFSLYQLLGGNHLIFLSLSSFIYKMGLIIVLISEGCCDD